MVLSQENPGRPRPSAPANPGGWPPPGPPQPNAICREVFGSKGRIKYAAIPTNTHPMSFRTHSIHSPDRGSFSRLPEKMARKTGQPQTQAQREKDQKSQPRSPTLATQVSSPSTKGPMHGAATTPRVRPMNRLPK